MKVCPCPFALRAIDKSFVPPTADAVVELKPRLRMHTQMHTHS